MYSAFLEVVLSRKKSASVPESGYSPWGAWALSEDMVALARHPELEQVMVNLGITVVRVPVPVRTIKVKEGDTLWQIASESGNPWAWKAIGAVNANKLTSWNRIETGDDLNIPTWVGARTSLRDYEVKAEDKLQTIAEEKLGKEVCWGVLFVMNHHKLRRPDTVPANSRLRLPDKSSAIVNDATECIEMKAMVVK